MRTLLQKGFQPIQYCRNFQIFALKLSQGIQISNIYIPLITIFNQKMNDPINHTNWDEERTLNFWKIFWNSNQSGAFWNAMAGLWGPEATLSPRLANWLFQKLQAAYKRTRCAYLTLPAHKVWIKAWEGGDFRAPHPLWAKLAKNIQKNFLN